MTRYLPKSIDCGPFATTKKNMDEFCNNLFLTRVINDCVKKLIEAQQEYDNAVFNDNAYLMEQKRLEIDTYEASLQLTAYMFDEVDHIET